VATAMGRLAVSAASTAITAPIVAPTCGIASSTVMMMASRAGNGAPISVSPM
jgi:hypothetical protein